jgi:hypothetical protein
MINVKFASAHLNRNIDETAIDITKYTIKNKIKKNIKKYLFYEFEIYHFDIILKNIAIILYTLLLRPSTPLLLCNQL